MMHPNINFVLHILHGCEKPWFIAGGWSIDIGLGKITREHHDLDICIFREDLMDVIAFFSRLDD